MMSETSIEKIQKEAKKMDQDVLRAVYALNMCTVSVSQIVDYNDEYILEQEYEAILNNLNLEKMPKAEALKNILVQLLNTITFFRIQEIKKQAIEKKYQDGIKNAIWHAIPNLNVIVAGGGVPSPYSIATQVGIGYMNYRKEKSRVKNEKEKEEMELRITALEQFNALRRELFTTAWELAEEYNFEDRLRLTEKQIKQYNQIIMDQNELRKYARLEAIQDKFEAFPPFWYFFGHTACYIAGDETLSLDDNERDMYREKAKQHFTRYEELNKFNILREDQMTSAFALEFIDLLLLEKHPDRKRINNLIAIADEMSGNSLDIKELCAISYLKIGNTDKAALLFKQLVNEDYNAVTNAKILSRIYVSQFLQGAGDTAKLEYKTLKLRIGEENAEYLYPMPENKVDDKLLLEEHSRKQKDHIQRDYGGALKNYFDRYIVRFNALIPAPYGYKSAEEYYADTEHQISVRCGKIKAILDSKGRDEFIEKIKSVDFIHKYHELLNDMLAGCDDLEIWRSSEAHDQIIESLRAILRPKAERLLVINSNMATGVFSETDYRSLQTELGIKPIIEELSGKMLDAIDESINNIELMNYFDDAEYNLVEFCNNHNITLDSSYEDTEKLVEEEFQYIEPRVIGLDDETEKKRDARLKDMKKALKNSATDLILNNSKDIVVLLPGSPEFDDYFRNPKLKKTYGLKDKTLAILDDNSKKNKDLVFTEDSIFVVEKYTLKKQHLYKDIKSKDTKKGFVLDFGWGNEYYNENVDVQKLYEIIDGFR